MTASVVVRLSLEDTIKRKISAAEKQIEREAVEHAALIKANVNRGKGYDGSSLKPYEESYQEQRRSEGLQVSPPNLRRTGNMMQSLTSRAGRQGDGYTAEIFFSGGGSGRGPSAAAKAQYVLDKGFDFFGYSREQKRDIIRRVEEAIEDER